ncbi:MAG: hypothetical protein ACLP5H_29105, partial [Desulfomonilaceae bacterium]
MAIRSPRIQPHTLPLTRQQLHIIRVFGVATGEVHFAKRTSPVALQETHRFRNRMPTRFSRTIHLLYVLVAASAVYVFAHWPALTNPYVINDDVRQQIFWM